MRLKLYEVVLKLDILGHSKVETTDNYYISGSKDNQRRATEVLESVIQSETINNTINNI